MYVSVCHVCIRTTARTTTMTMTASTARTCTRTMIMALMATQGCDYDYDKHCYGILVMAFGLIVWLRQLA